MIYVVCKRCGGEAHERTEVVEYTRRRSLVLASIEGHAAHITAAIVDAGVFCSTACLMLYLTERP